MSRVTHVSQFEPFKGSTDIMTYIRLGRLKPIVSAVKAAMSMMQNGPSILKPE